MLSIKNLHASVEGEEILKGINLEIKAGEVHAIMGPNGSGKSTLSQVLAGNETFEVTQGEISLNGENLLDLETEERAREGIFLAFQYPVEIPGVSNLQFLRTAVNAMRTHRGEQGMNAAEFMKLAKAVSTKASPGARRSAMRFFRRCCCSQSWPFWMRQTQGSTLMPCRWFPRA
jgi:Fe-S cluster assembly ATP-binding protein